jgi:hypothetical protein
MTSFELQIPAHVAGSWTIGGSHYHVGFTDLRSAA